MKLLWMAKNMATQTKGKRNTQGAKTDCAKMKGLYPVGAFEYRTLPNCSAYGIYAKPPEGTELVVMSTERGDVCLGAVTMDLKNLEVGIRPAAGEVLIRSEGGAYVKLCANGSIILNGMVIGKNGQIV